MSSIQERLESYKAAKVCVYLAILLLHFFFSLRAEAPANYLNSTPSLFTLLQPPQEAKLAAPEVAAAALAAKMTAAASTKEAVLKAKVEVRVWPRPRLPLRAPHFPLPLNAPPPPP